MVTPTPSPSPSSSPAPDTLYVQESTTKAIREYKGASTLNGLAEASDTFPTQDSSWGDVIYNPASDTLWYATAYISGFTSNQAIETWDNASTQNGMNPFKVPFSFGEGSMAYDSNHHLLFVATTQGPQVSVYTNPETMTASATPAAVITMQIVDGNGSTPRPQEMLYDPGTDRLFVSDTISTISVFDGFGTAAETAVTDLTNPTIPPNRYMNGLFSPDGLAYAPPPTDVLFVGEQAGNIIDVIHNASTFSGGVAHSQEITGFSHVGGLAYDSTIRGLLFVYDTTIIYVIPNAIAESGPLGSIVGLHSIQDGSSSGNDGFGIYLDQTH